MKYRGIEIGKPTLEMVQEYICRMGFGFSATEIFDFYQPKNWTTKKGQPIKTLEAMVNSFNGSYCLSKCRDMSPTLFS